MATNILSIDPTLNAAGDIVSLEFSGDSDRIRILLELTSPTNVAFSSSPQTLPDPTTGEWSIVLVEGIDFFPGDISCSDDLDINVLWLDPNSGWVQEDNYPIKEKIDCARAPKCTITIDTLEGIESTTSSGMSELIVTGTADVCTEVKVTVTDDNGASVTASAEVDNGTWEASFVLGATGVESNLKAYECKEGYKVRAECAEDKDCFAEDVLQLECIPGCPNFADVEVTSGSDPSVSFTNPEVGDMQCLPAGDYTISVTSPADSQVDSYVWFKNQDESNPVGTSRSLDVTLGNAENVSYTVAIEMIDGCSPDRTVVFSCGGTAPQPPGNGGGGNGDDDNDNGNGGGNGDDDDGQNGGGNGGVCDPCCIWFIINIIAVFATLVAFVIAGCVFQWLDPVSTSIAVGLAVGVTISIIFWAIACAGRSGGSCQPILRWIDILDTLTVLAAILALLVGVTTPCAIAFWVNTGFLQWIRRLLQLIAMFTGCLPNPWFTLRR
jgi:hypothetical protein